MGWEKGRKNLTRTATRCEEGTSDLFTLLKKKREKGVRREGTKREEKKENRSQRSRLVRASGGRGNSKTHVPSFSKRINRKRKRKTGLAGLDPRTELGLYPHIKYLVGKGKISLPSGRKKVKERSVTRGKRAGGRRGKDLKRRPCARKPWSRWAGFRQRAGRLLRDEFHHPFRRKRKG